MNHQQLQSHLAKSRKNASKEAERASRKWIDLLHQAYEQAVISAYNEAVVDGEILTPDEIHESAAGLLETYLDGPLRDGWARD
jgi:hypothetical protein